jgi:hypothetical protein
MPLPPNFSSVEHLQDVTKNILNKRVRAHFRDVGPDDWVPNLETDRGQLRIACTHLETDTINETITRLLLFNIEVGSAFGNLAPFYGMPIATYQESIIYKPQIQLHFTESPESAARYKRVPVRSEISFRLMNESSTSLTQAEVERLALKVRDLFAKPTPFKFQRGRTKFSYREPEKGYHFVVSSYDEENARKLIEQVLDIQGHTPNWENLTDSESRKNWDKTEYQQILGKRQIVPRKRPVAVVTFRKAELKIHGLPKDIMLVAAHQINDKTAIYYF